MSKILKGLNESRNYGRDSWDSNMPGYQGDYGGAENFGRKKRDWDENDAIDAQLRQKDLQRREYEKSGKFWLKFKDSQRHLPAGPFIGKQAANVAAIDLLKKQPELKGNLLITAYGPDEKLNELSPETLASYKKKAGQQASELDKAAFSGDSDAKKKIAKANKRFSGIVKATKKEFEQDKKEIDEVQLKTMRKYFAGDKNAQDELKITQMRQYFDELRKKEEQERKRKQELQKVAKMGSSIKQGVTEATEAISEEQLEENLRKWFKEKWVRFGPDGKIRGNCARGDDSEGKPKCLPQSKAHSLGKKGRASAAARKRREDPNPERRGPAKNVATKKKSNEGVTETVHPDITSKKYFIDPTKNVKMGDFEFNARTFTGGLADPNARGLQIRAYDPSRPKGSGSIGSADFIVKSDKKGNQWLESDDTDVDDEYRGKGVATMMYAFAKSLGNDIKDSPYKSKAGADMWSKWGSDAKHLVGEQGVAEAELDEACWKGYHKEGNKKMFGKTYPNCVKNTNEEQEHKCPHCGGEMVSEELMNEKKDACYYKVKSRYKVWPSAYASGALVKCRKKGAANWGNKSESVAEAIRNTAEFGSRYAEQLAQKVFDQNSNLDTSGRATELLNAGYAIARAELGKIASGIFRDEDFPSDFVSSYNWLKKQGVAEGLDAEAYKQKLLSSLPQMMRFYEKNVQGWKPSEEQMLAAVETGYTVMKHTGDVKQAGKAVMDELNTLHLMSQGQQGVAEGSSDKPEAGDKIIWYHSNHYPKLEGEVVGWKDGHLIVKSIDPSPRNTEKTVATYRVPKNNVLSVEKQGVAETKVSKYKDLGATKSTTHFIKNVTTGKIVSPHRSRQDAEDALVASMRDSNDEFKIVRARKEGVAEEQLDEKWSQKYKDSINCSNPKGFSQKAHCAGKKKNESFVKESAIMKGLK